MLQENHTLVRAFPSFMGLLGLVIIGVASSGRGLAAQEVSDTTRVTISGTVYDSRTYGPLPGATLRFSGTDHVMETNEEGEFALAGLLTGTYLLVVAAPGYQELRVPLQVIRNGSLNIPLEVATGVAVGGRTNRIIGRIREAGTSRAVEGAEVTLSGVQGFQVTGSDGRFEFPSVPHGFTTLTVRSMGLGPMTDDLNVDGSETLELDIRLAPDPVEMAPMEVTVTRRNAYLEDMGFYNRIEKGYSGQYISRETLEERRPRTMADVFHAVNGLMVGFDGLGRYSIRVSRSIRFNTAEGCVPKVMLDDVPSDIGWLQDIQPDRIAGMEVYTGVNAPLRYNDPCGVILIWTRRGDRRGGG